MTRRYGSNSFSVSKNGTHWPVDTVKNIDIRRKMSVLYQNIDKLDTKQTIWTILELYNDLSRDYRPISVILEL